MSARVPPEPTPPGIPMPRLRLDRDRPQYLQDIARILDLIRRGETYEACLTNQVRGPCHIDPLALYHVLRRTNPAPYAAFLRFPGMALLSASPERFIAIDAAGRAESRPIKGTRRRGADAAEDQRIAHELATADKDRAENLMIVDLVRNDLGRVCEVGSVTVPALMTVETHPTVFQLVSTVRGQLRADVGPLAAVRALFPGGSMTGAPKRRTLEILHALEGRPRGAYAGGLGWLGADGALDLGMTIRTLILHGGEVSFGVGGAVVADSDPAAEFDEILTKAYALVRALALAHAGRFTAEDMKLS
jgi:para-aminobenzoate synthetase